jgi:hypothetical protein
LELGLKRVGRVLRSFDSVLAWIGVYDCHFENFHLGCMGKECCFLSLQIFAQKCSAVVMRRFLRTLYVIGVNCDS